MSFNKEILFLKISVIELYSDMFFFCDTFVLKLFVAFDEMWLYKINNNKVL